MSWAWTVGGSWLLPGLLGGGLILLLTWALALRVREPARRQRLGEWGMAAALVAFALSFAPSWLSISVPAPAATAPAVVTPPDPLPSPEPPCAADSPEFSRADGPARLPAPDEDAVRSDLPEWVWVLPDPIPGPTDPDADLPHPAPAASSPAPEPSPGLPEPEGPWTGSLSVREVVGWLGALHAGVALVLLGRWLLGHLGLWRVLRRAGPVPEQVRAACASLAGPRPLPRLLCSRRLRVPISCGLFRPAIVLPVALCDRPEGPALRWVLAHEMTHLERRDALACLLFGLGQVIFFPWPWFWWLRRQVRLCQEYVADAAAAPDAAEDYAEFLLSLTATPGLPAGAVGVLGHSSDLFRRVTMLLHTRAPVARRSPRLWSLGVAAGLLALAVLIAGIGLRADAAPAPQDPVKQEEPKKEEPKKEEPKKEEPKKEEPRKKPVDVFPDPEKLFPNLPPGVPPEQMKDIQERMQRMMEEMRERMRARGFPGGAPAPFPGLDDFTDPFNPLGQRQTGRLGVVAQKPSDALVDQLDLPKGQGVVIEKVLPDSAAAKAGLKPNDILLEVHGKPVPSKTADLAKMLEEIKADTAVDVVVLRKGKKETIKGVKLPEAKAARPAFPGFPGAVPGVELPPVPAIPAPFPGPGGFPGAPGGFPFGGQGIMTSLFRSNERFTGRHQEGSLVITVTGTVTDGKAKTSEITVQDGAVSNKYESVDKVPEQYRDKVKNLIEMSEKGAIKVEIRSP